MSSWSAINPDAGRVCRSARPNGQVLDCAIDCVAVAASAGPVNYFLSEHPVSSGVQRWVSLVVVNFADVVACRGAAKLWVSGTGNQNVFRQSVKILSIFGHLETQSLNIEGPKARRYHLWLHEYSRNCSALMYTMGRFPVSCFVGPRA
jgi:hypothetical protein